MARHIQFVDSSGTVQAILPMDREIFDAFAPFLADSAAFPCLARLADCRADVIWSQRETAALRQEIGALQAQLDSPANATGRMARDFAWRFEQFLRKAELEGLQVRALKDHLV